VLIILHVEQITTGKQPVLESAKSQTFEVDMRRRNDELK
jgi:hypothetical protein